MITPLMLSGLDSLRRKATGSIALHQGADWQLEKVRTTTKQTAWTFLQSSEMKTQGPMFVHLVKMDLTEMILGLTNFDYTSTPPL